MPVSDSSWLPQRHAIARQRDAVGARQPDHADAIGRRQRFDEPGRGHERVSALEPADVRFVHRDHDDSAVVGAFVGAEMGWRTTARRRDVSDVVLRNKLCRNDRRGTAIDLETEVLGAQGAHRPAVARRARRHRR